MIPLLTVSGMRAIDKEAIAGEHAVGYSYMLEAGIGLFEAVLEMVPGRGTSQIAVVCGKGNNGGDGYVVARLLHDAGYQVRCYGLCDGPQLSGEARTAFDEYIAHHGNFMVLDDAADLAEFSCYDLIIDALLGTGTKGNPRGFFATVIEAVNRYGKRVLAVDTPSGMDNDTGAAGDPCIRADVTVTMGFPKLGACFYPGRARAGQLIIRNLGYPENIVESNHCGIYYPQQARFRFLLPPRKPAGSKFDHGLVCMVCGSRGMTGSAVLASRAALRSGCGMVHLAVPHSALPSLSARLTETVLYGIDETPAGTPAVSAVDRAHALATGKQVLCIGSGLSHEESTVRFVQALVARAHLPTVLDADGINAFKGAAQALKSHSAPLVITPHAGEWARLFGELPGEPAAAIETLQQTAREYRMTILYKGNPTIIADPDGTAVVMPVGNSGMATAGSGDVLTGIIAGLCAQGAAPVNAALLGCRLHAAAGDCAAARFTEYGMIAGDMIECIPDALKELVEP